jgi:hypothetical protein
MNESAVKSGSRKLLIHLDVESPTVDMIQRFSFALCLDYVLGAHPISAGHRGVESARLPSSLVPARNVSCAKLDTLDK